MASLIRALKTILSQYKKWQKEAALPHGWEEEPALPHVWLVGRRSVSCPWLVGRRSLPCPLSGWLGEASPAPWMADWKEEPSLPPGWLAWRKSLPCSLIAWLGGGACPASWMVGWDREPALPPGWLSKVGRKGLPCPLDGWLVRGFSPVPGLTQQGVPIMGIYVTLQALDQKNWLCFVLPITCVSSRHCRKCVTLRVDFFCVTHGVGLFFYFLDSYFWNFFV